MHQFFSLAAGMGLMAFLASWQGPTHHLFWPVFAYGAAACLASLALGYVLALVKFNWMSSWIKRVFFAIVISGGIASAAELQFSQAQIPHKLDEQEYKDAMMQHFQGPPQTSGITPADLDFLKFMVQTYEPMGVDVSDAKSVIDDASKLADDLQRQAEAREKARAEAKGEKVMKAALVREEIEAARLKRQQAEAAAKAKAKKKKKKKKKTATANTASNQ
jgi:hypothetical protein